MFRDVNDLNEFIFSQSKNLIGEKGMIGSAVVIFEFIDEDGHAGYSLLRPPGGDWEESLNLLFKASSVIKESYENGTGISNDDEFDDKDF